MPKDKRKQAEEIQASSILGDTPVLTAQQREQLKKEEKAAKKAQKKEEMRQLRAEAKERVASKNESKQMTIILLVMISIMVLAVALLASGQASVGGMEAKEGMTYYLDNTQLAEMGDSGISGAVTEVYYTKNGGLHVSLNFANAEATTQHPTKISVKLMNGSDEVIASASVSEIHEDYYIVAGGRNTYEMFIPKKYVTIPDDSLSVISADIVVEYEDYHSEEEN